MNDGPHRMGVFEALANPCRRQLLLAMVDSSATADDPVDATELLHQGDRPEDAEDIRIELYHVHLPKLEEMGVIEWDRGSGELSRGPDWEAAAPLLRLMDDHQDELPAWLSDPRCGE